VGFVVLKLTQYFLQRARKLAPTHITRPLHHHASSSKASCLDGLSSPDTCPLSSPPPLSSHLSHTAASPHPSPSRRRRGKIPSIVVILHSNDDASRRPPPHLYSRGPTSALVAASATTSPPPPSSLSNVERPSLRRMPPQHFC